MGTYKRTKNASVAIMLLAILLLGFLAFLSDEDEDDLPDLKHMPTPTVTLDIPAYPSPSVTEPSYVSSAQETAVQSVPRGTVKAGSFCSQAGAIGYTGTGARMVCTKGSDGRYRWRQG